MTRRTALRTRETQTVNELDERTTLFLVLFHTRWWIRWCSVGWIGNAALACVWMRHMTEGQWQATVAFSQSMSFIRESAFGVDDATLDVFNASSSQDTDSVLNLFLFPFEQFPSQPGYSSTLSQRKFTCLDKASKQRLTTYFIVNLEGNFLVKLRLPSFHIHSLPK